MNNEDILFLITLIIEWIFGFISKKKNIKTDLIPYQNLLIGIIMAIINLFITRDFQESLTISGLFAGGIYDLVHNLKKIILEHKKN